MNGVKYLFVITHSDFMEGYLEFFKQQGIASVEYNLCMGTATQKVLNVLGLQHKEKFMLQMMVSSDRQKKILNGLSELIESGGNDNGVAFTVPVDAIGGETAKNYLVGANPIKKGGKEMDIEKSKCVLILTIVDKGNTDAVMDAAREAGASGGTVVKGKGTGTEIAKVFGMSISEEKEIVYIVSERAKRNDIMYAIMEKAGPNSSAHGITFSLPVDGVLGIKSLEKLFN